MESIRYEKNGYVEWRNEQGQLHRIDGPAFESADGTQEWWENGKLTYTYDPNEDE